MIAKAFLVAAALSAATIAPAWSGMVIIHPHPHNLDPSATSERAEYAVMQNAAIAPVDQI